MIYYFIFLSFQNHLREKYKDTIKNDHKTNTPSLSFTVVASLLVTKVVSVLPQQTESSRLLCALAVKDTKQTTEACICVSVCVSMCVCVWLVL